MTKKLLQALVKESITNNELNSEKVLAIANELSRKELKEYIHALKKWVQQHTVVVESASAISEKSVEKLQLLFADKQLDIRINSNLILGATITDNDIIYRLSVKDRLNDLKHHIAHEEV